VLLGTSALMALPSVMVFLSLALKPRLNRWLNIGLGSFYTLIMIVTMPGAWAFYIFLGVIEVALTALIVWYAWTWPKQQGSQQDTRHLAPRLIAISRVWPSMLRIEGAGVRIDRPIVSSEKLLKQALRVGTQDSGDLDKFDDIEPAFARLKSTN
jgi:hypothetical protein